MSTSKRTKKFLLIIIMEKPNLNGIRISRPNEYLYINLRTVYNWFTVHYLSDRISHIFHVSWSHFFIFENSFSFSKHMSFQRYFWGPCSMSERCLYVQMNKTHIFFWTRTLFICCKKKEAHFKVNLEIGSETFVGK